MSSVPPASFVDPRPTARTVMGVLVFGSLIDGHRLLFAIAQGRTSDLLSELPNAGLHLLVRAATAVLFLLWIDRVWSNMIALGGRPEHSRAAAVYSFFVPPFCFFRPVRIVNDVWAGAAWAPARRRSVVDAWMPRLVTVWWIAVLINPVLALTAYRRDEMGATERWLRVLAGESLNITAGILAFGIIFLVSRRQHDARAVLRQARGEARETASAPPATTELMVAAETADSPRIAIAPAARLSSPAHGSVWPVERLVRTQQVRRPSVEQAVDAVSPVIWQRTLVGAAAVTAAALIGSGAVLIGDPRSLALALIQLGFATIISGAAFTIARQQPLPGTGRRLGLLAGAAVTTAIIALIAIAVGLAG